MARVNDLVDTTEMYLRTVYELEEEGIVPLRARIAERLRQSGPTVSQTVARMERDGLVTVQGDRHLELTVTGRNRAIAVMRKHRLAELLLLNVIGMDWSEVHVEACRWEHVMSEDVERRLIPLLDNPVESPHGNPIPGLADIGGKQAPEFRLPLLTLEDAATTGGRTVVLRRISEQLQPDTELMHLLAQAGIRPGHQLEAHKDVDGGVRIKLSGDDANEDIHLDELAAAHLYVSPS
jgi:DtxR family transcriptional regulator, iron-dependent repressor